jgi:hypothetical protein
VVAPNHGWYIRPGADGFGAADPAALGDLIVEADGAGGGGCFSTRGAAVASLRVRLKELRAESVAHLECADHPPPAYDLESNRPVLEWLRAEVSQCLAKIDKRLSILDAADVLEFHEREGDRYCFAAHLVGADGPVESLENLRRAYDFLAAAGLVEPAAAGNVPDAPTDPGQSMYRLKQREH